MRAVFADTFYWVALTNPDDTRYRDAVAFDKVLTGATIFTTDEVLVEFMTFFAADPCNEAALLPQYAGFLRIRGFVWSHRAGIRFWLGSTYTSRAPTRATA